MKVTGGLTVGKRAVNFLFQLLTIFRVLHHEIKEIGRRGRDGVCAAKQSRGGVVDCVVRRVFLVLLRITFACLLNNNE